MSWPCLLSKQAHHTCTRTHACTYMVHWWQPEDRRVQWPGERIQDEIEVKILEFTWQDAMGWQRAICPSLEHASLIGRSQKAGKNILIEPKTESEEKEHLFQVGGQESGTLGRSEGQQSGDRPQGHLQPLLPATTFPTGLSRLLASWTHLKDFFI